MSQQHIVIYFDPFSTFAVVCVLPHEPLVRSCVGAPFVGLFCLTLYIVDGWMCQQGPVTEPLHACWVITSELCHK